LSWGSFSFRRNCEYNRVDQKRNPRDLAGSGSTAQGVLPTSSDSHFTLFARAGQASARVFVLVLRNPKAVYPTGVAPAMPKRKRATAVPPPGDEGNAFTMDQFVSTKRAAELLGVEQSHIRLLLGRNRLRCSARPAGRGPTRLFRRRLPSNRI
jgi:hypothetical protein